MTPSPAQARLPVWQSPEEELPHPTDSKIYSLAIDLLKVCAGLLLGVALSHALSSRTAQVFSFAISFFGSFFGSIAGCALAYCLYSRMSKEPQPFSEPVSPDPSQADLQQSPFSVAEPAGPAADVSSKIPKCPEGAKNKIRFLFHSLSHWNSAALAFDVSFIGKKVLRGLGDEIENKYKVNHLRFLIFLCTDPDTKSYMRLIFEDQEKTDKSAANRTIDKKKFETIQKKFVDGVRAKMEADPDLNNDAYLADFARELELDEEMVTQSIRACARTKDFGPFVRSLFAEDGAPLTQRSPA